MKKNIVLLFCFLLLLSGCSFNVPSIQEVFFKHLFVETENGKTAERLSVFLRFLDEDGREDYNSIILIHDESGMTWTLDRLNSAFFISEDEDTKKKHKHIWAGSNKIAVPQGKIPQGAYSVIVEDSAGNRTIKKSVISSENAPDTFPFKFLLNNENWEIHTEDFSVYKNYSLVLLAADRQPIVVHKIPFSSDNVLSGNLHELKENHPDARYVQCMAENSNGTIAYLTKFYNLY